MIRLEKTDKPNVLVKNAERWKSEYMSCIASGIKPKESLATAYNHHTIKKALEMETHDKCAYCESKITHVSHGDIEHILPKNKDARPDLCYEWSNLTLACEKCNQSGKGTYYNENCQLINPYVDYPEEHFLACGEHIYSFTGDTRATITLSKLDLNRPKLLEVRLERMKGLLDLISQWKRLDDSNQIKKDIEEQIHEEYSNDKEYSFVKKGFIASSGFPVKRIKSCT